jgi:hypothetical protein
VYIYHVSQILIVATPKVGIMIAAAPLSHDIAMASTNRGELPTGSISVPGIPTAEEASPGVHQLTIESQGDAAEVTIQQVAPLVVVLTGATFLNASTVKQVSMVGHF